MQEFKNLLEVTQYFSDEKTCREYLAQSRWNGNPICPYCGHTKVYVIEGGKRYKCANKDCFKKFSVTVGTIFEDTNLPLQKWFIAMYLACNHKKGISSLQLSRDLDITQKTAWFVLHRIREMLKDNAPELLENMVEVDETFIGGLDANKHKSKKANKGRGPVSKTPVVGLLERGNKVRAEKMLAANKAVLIPKVQQYVKPGTLVITDNSKAYVNLRTEYIHEVVSHSTGEYARGMIHTNTLEGYWSLLKRGIIGIYHCVSVKHLNRYCDEFSYRYNHRKDGQNLSVTNALLQAEGRRLKYFELTAKD